MKDNPRIIIAGAGTIGCFVGGVLAHAGRDVALLGRGAVAERVARDGLHLSDNDGWDAHIPASEAGMTVDPAALASADVIFVTVKSGATQEMAEGIARFARPEAIIVSLQNGVTNAPILKEKLPGRDVRAGVVPFNVVQTGDGRFHRATSGVLIAAKGPVPIAGLFEGSCLGLEEKDGIEELAWGKLLINLNNALNALSGIPLIEQMSDRRWRKLMAWQMEEGMAALEAAGIDYQGATPISPRWMAKLLRLPTFLFRKVAARTFRIDPEARSSMAEDFDRGRTTEVDALQGAVIELGQRHGVPVPIATRVRDLVKAAERRGEGSPRLSPDKVAPGRF
ncbi:2-dehydropantoate 2-reductase [Sphingomicrobium lutaoense]|uniref:2-dehydropantoate 2-reductase n=1 Tax=Sphingomicrobium lutaoense TaxID=515949 RepID=A0A839Z2U2_9SPHN|nr:2-dehydropantoate 2-reductase [Sphingomicrobium lutaoense]MBB3764940.1 2-dehydropantoate 2-reductase [Sphingomicrobium lutaoense]